jgi:hypothetical protein
MSEICQWFDCNEPATIRIPSTNGVHCKNHYLLNCLRFSCDLKGEVIAPPNSEVKG